MEQQPNAQHESAAIHPFKNANTTQFPHLIKFLTQMEHPHMSVHRVHPGVTHLHICDAGLLHN